MVDSSFEVLGKDANRTFLRTQRTSADGTRSSVLAARPSGEPPTGNSLDRLSHEYGLKDKLDSAWSVRPLELVRQGDRAVLVFEDPGGEPLDRLLGAPFETGRFLQLAISITAAVGGMHRRGLVHKDLKPAHMLVDESARSVRLTGFGLATLLPRERQSPVPPEIITGTFAYMAPEQTGRMNRSIDARSDLYSLGVTFYQMLTASLPFTASEPMEWVHCHIARRPVPPSERVDCISAQVSRIVMKQLAKAAEERYQTAAGLEHDLRRCLTEWEAHRHIARFPLGERDVPDRLLIPEKLYGRERELATLLTAFDCIVAEGTPRLVLISGYSGIGKSSVVNELHKVLVPPRGLFASGKFDQYKRDIPYSTLVQALQSLVRPLLGKREDELEGWRVAFLEALGQNAKLIVDLLPELELIIGEQPPVPALSPKQAQSRFQLVFRRFIEVFARAEHPLAIFLDDLQWLDAATLDLLEDLMTRPDLHHLMLIGAYRDNEVDALHPLVRKIEAIKLAGAKVDEIALAPLRRRQLAQLTADALCCDIDRAAPLAELVHRKTAGNPFFVIQFLHALADEELLRFEHDAGRWSWELEHIESKGYTDNVADFMVAKLSRMPIETQRVLQELSCLGNIARIATLSVVHGTPEETIRSVLWEAVRSELVERFQDSYRFIHDRVHEAAYSMIPEQVRAESHLRIGRLFAARTPPQEREEAIFEIVNQLNRAASLITSREEREQLAEFNLIAGKRAKSATAHASALNYLAAGTALLADDCWKRTRELVFALWFERAECEFLTGHLAAANERLTALSSRSATVVERAAVACLHMDVCTFDQNDRAIPVALDYLHHVNIHWSPHPTDEEVRQEYERIWSQLGDRRIEDLIDLPLMNDRDSLATVDVLIKVLPSALYTDANLVSLTICRAVNLSIERGNCDASCFAYVTFSIIAGPRFGDYRAGYRFGRLGYDLVERRGLTRFNASTYLVFAVYVMHWIKHVRFARDLVRRAFDAANRIGDLHFAAYARNNLNSHLLFAGDPLPEVQREAEYGLAFAQKARFGVVVDYITAQLAFIQTLRGLTPKFGSFDNEQLKEAQFERHLSSNPVLTLAECWYWIRKLQARYLAGDFEVAMDAASRAQRVLWTSTSFFEEAEYHFYSALTSAACCDGASAGERQRHLESLAAHHRQLSEWARNCPENFENRVALVGAEIARFEGRELEAERLYEQAIGSARANDFVQQEALANELAARFYAARGFERIAQMYLRDAQLGYLRWGADGKARQLAEAYPQLETKEPAPAPTSTIGARVEHLDLDTVIKVSQAVSSEIVLDKLLDTLMRTAIEQAGAQRGLLVLSKDAEPRIKAQAESVVDAVVVHITDEPVAAAVLPEMVLHHVLRTRESVIVSDAVADNSFAADPYIALHQTRSMLCMPLISQAKLIGALYLENSLAPGVFHPARIAVLKVLASQAAMTLENARLYYELAEREAKIRRLVDANIIGILIFDLEGGITEANDAFLQIVGYDREDLISGRLRWTELTPPGWLDRDLREWVPELKRTGILPPFEKEYFRKDGTCVPVLLGVASLEDGGNQGVAFVLDLTERKKAEVEARESERRYREVQTALAHANRVTTMGQLAASISHEIKQPIAATAANAQAGLLWLGAEPPNLEEARQSFDRIIKDIMRAGEIINRIRGLVKNIPPCKERLQTNEMIREVIALTRGEAEKNRVSMRTRFAEELPPVEGDRVQLQQVMLNLIMNAIEAMSAVEDGPREVVVSTGKDESSGVLITVSDSGPGVTSDDLERLFTPFYTTKATGMGMGLPICRSIIEAHDGRLWARANAPQGAIFQFTLPAQTIE